MGEHLERCEGPDRREQRASAPHRCETATHLRLRTDGAAAQEDPWHAAPPAPPVTSAGLETLQDTAGRIQDNIERVIEGKPDVVRLALVVLLAEGHLLIEDVPGVGKTMLAKALARSVDCTVRRIQFTPDLLPSDVTGVSVFDQERRDFEFKPGAVFANIVVGDEINRASPKTQSALLEAMEERQVTVDGTTYELETPFMVVATQNPVEMEGTYPLPEAQRDRFTARVSMGYPSLAAELDMLDTHGGTDPLDDLEPVADAQDVRKLIEVVHGVHVADAVKRYVVDLVDGDPRVARAAPRRLAPLHPAAGPGRPRAGRPRRPRLRAPRRRAVPRRGRARAPAAAHRGGAGQPPHARGGGRRPAHPRARPRRARMRDLRLALRGLTTRGRCLLWAGAALAACAVLIGQRDLLRAAVFLLVLPLAAVAVVARTRYRLACTRSVQPARVPVGVTAQVHLRVDNVSRLPSGALRMEDTLPYALGGRPRFVLDRVEPRGVREVDYPVVSQVRGRHRVGPLSVRMADPFGLCELARSFTSSSELVVTPAVVPLPPVPLGGDWAGGGETSSRATASSGSDDVSTREYRHGDDLRKVHWRSTARVGELMVRREEQPYQSRATLLLDTRASAHRGDGPGSSFEWAVSAVASIGVSLLRAGYAVKVVTSDDRPLTPPGVALSEGLLLDALAGVGTTARRDVEPAVERLRRGIDGTLLAVLGACDAAATDRLARLRSGSTGCTALLLETGTWVPPGATGRRPAPEGPDPVTALIGTGWRVHRVPRGTPVDVVWSALGGRHSAARPATPDPAATPGPGAGTLPQGVPA